MIFQICRRVNCLIQKTDFPIVIGNANSNFNTEVTHLVDYSHDQYLLGGRLLKDSIPLDIPFISATQQNPNELKLQFTLTVMVSNLLANDIQKFGDIEYDHIHDVIFAVTAPDLFIIKITDHIFPLYSLAQITNGGQNFNCGTCKSLQLVYQDGGSTFPNIPFLYLAFHSSISNKFNAIRFYSSTSDHYKLIKSDNIIEGFQIDYASSIPMYFLIDNEFWLVTIRQDTNRNIELIQMRNDSFTTIQQSEYSSFTEEQFYDYGILKKFIDDDGFSSFRGCMKFNRNGYNQLGFLTMDYEQQYSSRQIRTYELGLRDSSNECFDYQKYDLTTNILLVRAVDTNFKIQYILLKLQLDPVSHDPLSQAAFILDLQAQNSQPFANDFVQRSGKFIANSMNAIIFGSLEVNGRLVSMIVTNEPSKGCYPTEIPNIQPTLDIALKFALISTYQLTNLQDSSSYTINALTSTSLDIVIINQYLGLLENNQYAMQEQTPYCLSDELTTAFDVQHKDMQSTLPSSQESTLQFSYRLPTSLIEFNKIELHTTVSQFIDSKIPNELILSEKNGLLLTNKFSPTLINSDQTYPATITSRVSFYYILNESNFTLRSLSYIPSQDVDIQNWRLYFQQDLSKCSSSGSKFQRVLPIMNVMYQINTNAIQIDVNRFQLSHPGCASQVSYQIYVNDVNLNQQPRTFLKFNKQTNQLLISTSLGRDRGNYQITVTASLGGSESMSVQFLLTIVDKDFSNILKKPIETQNLQYNSTSDVLVSSGGEIVLDLSKSLGVYEDEVLKLSLQTIIQGFTLVTTNNNQVVTLKYAQPNNQESDEDFETVVFEIYNDSDATLPFKTVNLEVLVLSPELLQFYQDASKVASNSIITEQVMFGKIKKVDNKGRMTFLFQTNIEKIMSQKLIKRDFRIYLHRFSSTDNIESEEVYFEITKIASNQVEFQLYFEKQQQISISANFDKIYVRLIKSSTSHRLLNLLYIQNLNAKIYSLLETSQDVPRQLSQVDQEFLDAFDDAATTSLMIAFGLCFLLNIFLAVSLKHLWGAMNAFQIISHLPLVNLPANTVEFFQVVLEISAFQIYPTDFISTFFGISEDDLSPFSMYFEGVGYDSMNVLINLGTLMITIYITAIYYILYFMLNMILPRILFDKTAQSNKFLNLLSKFQNWSKQKLIYACVLALLIEAYFEIGLTSMLNLYDLRYDIASSLHSVILLSVIICFPFISGYFLYYNHEKLKRESFAAKYQTLYEGLRIDSQIAAQYQILNMIRKLIQITAFMIFDEYAFLQFFTLIFTSLGMIMYIILVKPFDDEFIYRMELFNEFTVIAIMYSMICFSEINQSDETKYDLGYFPIVLFALNFSVHILNLLIRALFNFKDILLSLFKKLRARFYKKKLLHTSLNNLYKINNSDEEKFPKYNGQLESRANGFFNFGQNNIVESFYNYNNCKKQQESQKQTSIIQMSNLTQKQKSNEYDKVEVIDLTSQEYIYGNVQVQQPNKTFKQQKTEKGQKPKNSKIQCDFDQISTISPYIYEKQGHINSNNNQHIHYLED
eukprot:403336344